MATMVIFGRLLELPVPQKLIYKPELKAVTGFCGCPGSQRIPLLWFALMCALPRAFSVTSDMQGRGGADEPTHLWPYKAGSQKPNQPVHKGYWSTLWFVLLGDSGSVQQSLKWGFLSGQKLALSSEGRGHSRAEPILNKSNVKKLFFNPKGQNVSLH